MSSAATRRALSFVLFVGLLSFFAEPAAVAFCLACELAAVPILVWITKATRRP